MNIFIFSAPSGAGKTTIVRNIMQAFPHLKFSVSATTRPIRGKEVDGVDYYFLSKDEFEQRVEAGDFLEWEEVYEGRFYGTLKSEVERVLAEGNAVVFDVDVKGGLNIKKHYGDQAVACFVMPPSIDTLRKRLENRGTESEVEIDKRCARAEYELSFAPQFDHLVVNDVLEDAIEQAKEIVQANSL